jgi:hypothetical protein
VGVQKNQQRLVDSSVAAPAGLFDRITCQALSQMNSTYEVLDFGAAMVPS